MIAENHLFSAWAWKLTSALCGCSKLTWVQCGYRIWLDFRVGMYLIWLLRGWSKLTCFLEAGRKSLVFSVSVLIALIPVWAIELYLIWVQDEMDLVVVWVVENDIISLWLVGIDLESFQCGGSALIWFLCSGRKWLVLVFGLKINAFLCRSIEVDLVLMWGSKLTWFQWWSRNYPGFYVREWNWIGFSVGIEFNFFCAGVKIEFGFVCGPKIICF